MKSSDSDADRKALGVGQDIAIVGMAGRFPGARSVEQFWANVRDGVESIRTLSDDALIEAGVTSDELDDPSYVKVSPVLDDIDKFDARFFGFSPRDASVMDPAHRFFLEVAWEAFEHAGYTALPSEGAVGVFAASGAPLYMQQNLLTNPELMRSMGDFLVRHTGNDMSFLATRVSYEMDLRGPSINVQTACSSALVALHLACQSLLRGECTLALAGGSTILVPQGQGYLAKEGEITSADGHCRPFDANSTGTVFGSGTGAVVLKRLQDALDDGDTIHAIVKGSAINNDGSVKVGYLAPGVDGQAEVIARALEVAGVPAHSIGYIETHGTGTLVGDPIEVEALNQAFRAKTERRHFCGIGSVKSNIGHLGEAAASASLSKAIMALKQRQLPPSLGFERANPAIDFDDSPFYVNSTLRAWESDEPRRCGITALGAGGTNCHVILEEAPESLEGEGARARQLLVLSAKSRSALERASENLAHALEAQPSLDLADAAYTLSVGRRALPHRRVVVASSHADAIEKLRARDVKPVDVGSGERPELVFMFPGGGAQYARMGIELYEREDVYREALDECLELLEPELGSQLRAQLLAPLEQAERATRELERPSLTLPALFATEYALAKLIMSWGVKPVAMTGHSMGEYVAACFADVMSLRDALRMVSLRGRLFEAVDPGAMLSVPMSESALREVMTPDLSIAAVNGPELSVASGPIASIVALEELLKAREIDCTRVRISVAAHSVMLDPILERFRQLCRTIELRAPQLPFASNLTGRWITAAEATDPEYWVQHLRNTVRFGECVETVRAGVERVLLEIGPGRTLSTLARAHRNPARHVFNSIRHPQEAASDLEYALATLGRLWAVGVDVHWPEFYASQLRNRVPLPTYPFEGKSYWVQPGAGRAIEPPTREGKRSDPNDWFYGVSWAELPLLASRSGEATRWLILAHDRGQAHALEKRLASGSTDTVVVVTPGESLVEQHDKAWWLDFRSESQIAQLFQTLDDRGDRFDHVVYLTGATRVLPNVGELKDLEQSQALNQNFYALVSVARSLGALAEPIRLTIVTSGLCDLEGERVDPRRALALGPGLVTPREHPQVRTRCIDVPARIKVRRDELDEQLIAELRSDDAESLVALRAGRRWVRRIIPLPVPKLEVARPWVRAGGVYLVTGGLGGIGHEVAKHIAGQARVKLALLARSALPPESKWDAILASGDRSSMRAQRIAKVRELRALGAEVMVVVGDVAEAAQLRRVLEAVREGLGPINGVIHSAGSMDDQPMQLKQRAAMDSVLRPKVQGTLLLDALIHEKLDLFLLFSSVASVLGLPGQVDYTAANSFLDAFAKQREQRARASGDTGRTLVVNWNAWRDVGMAEASYRGRPRGLEAHLPSTHPALDGYLDQGTRRVFSTDFASDRHWLLSEHKIKGSYALLPGTAFIELARAAYSEGRVPGPVELVNVNFLSPFQVAPGDTRRLEIDVEASGGGYYISMRSGDVPHVIGEARSYVGPAPDRLDVDAVRRRCHVRVETPKDGFLAQDFVVFGHRWANIKRVRYGASEALLELALPDDYHGDLEGYALHPALLDMATGGAQSLIPGVNLQTDFYVPLSYEKIVVFGPMPAALYSHVRCLPNDKAGLAYFDVTLSSSDGEVFAEISRFTMKRLDARSAMTAPVRTESSPGDARHNDALADILRDAMRPAEAIAAFDRVMAQPTLGQTLISSVDVLAWKARLDLAAASSDAQRSAEAAPAGFARPELDSTFEAPSTPSELALAEIWSELLGLAQVGVHDDFFELGGNSLVAVRLFAAVKKRFRVSLPLSTLFEAPTIRRLAAKLELPVEAAPAATTTATHERPRELVLVSDNDVYTPLVPIQTGRGNPFFCVHGAGGNVLNFQALAKRLGEEQAFYGLQAKGVNGGEPAHSIEEMATAYVESIRRVRPHGPYVLGGYSGGGVVAYEMAQRLRAGGETVSLAFLDTFHPSCRPAPPTLHQRLEYLVAEGAPYLLRTGMGKVRRIVEEYENDLRSRYYERRGVALPFELRDNHLTRAFNRAASQYETKVYEWPVTLFRARTSERAFAHVGPTLGWGKLIPKLEIIEVPGDHDTLMLEPNVHFLISHLKALIDAASASSLPERAVQAAAT